MEFQSLMMKGFEKNLQMSSWLLFLKIALKSAISSLPRASKRGRQGFLTLSSPFSLASVPRLGYNRSRASQTS